MTSINCVVGMAWGKANCLSLVFVACSYGNAISISLNSLNAVPMNAIPNGMLGPVERVGSAGAKVVFWGMKPRGTFSLYLSEHPF